MVGSRTVVTLGQRAQAGAKMLYEFLSGRFSSSESKSVASVPFPPARPSQDRSRLTSQIVVQ